MDFQPYSEYVLPADRGTGKIKKKLSGGANPSMAQPREFHYPSSEFILILDEDEEARLRAQHEHEHEHGAEDAQASPSAGLGIKAQVLPKEVIEMRDEEEGRKPAPAKSAAPAKPTASAKSAASEAERQNAEDNRRDFIFAYDGRFIGHYRSSKRITNRTAFKKVAQRLAEGIGEFDLERFALFKPVPIKVDPSVLEELHEDSFDWFEG